MEFVKGGIVLLFLSINDLRSSGLCCRIYRTPSAPVGYADDLATYSTSTYNLDKAINEVAARGCTWRYSFNAKKNGILVNGEDKYENAWNIVTYLQCWV